MDISFFELAFLFVLLLRIDSEIWLMTDWIKTETNFQGIEIYYHYPSDTRADHNILFIVHLLPMIIAHKM